MCHFPGKFFPKDVCYLVGLTNFTVLVGEDNLKEFCARGGSLMATNTCGKMLSRKGNFPGMLKIIGIGK